MQAKDEEFRRTYFGYSSCCDQVADQLCRARFYPYLSQIACAKVYLIALEQAWTSDYVGTDHEYLLAKLNAMSRSKPYSNSVTITQSSGTGKSRLVDEQGKLVFTIPFNLRPLADSKGQTIEFRGMLHSFTLNMQSRCRISISRRRY